MIIKDVQYVHVHVLYKIDEYTCTCAVLLCLVCLFDLACFFLSSHLSLKTCICTCTYMYLLGLRGYVTEGICWWPMSTFRL